MKKIQILLTLYIIVCGCGVKSLREKSSEEKLFEDFQTYFNSFVEKDFYDPESYGRYSTVIVDSTTFAEHWAYLIRIYEEQSDFYKDLESKYQDLYKNAVEINKKSAKYKSPEYRKLYNDKEVELLQLVNKAKDDWARENFKIDSLNTLIKTDKSLEIFSITLEHNYRGTNDIGLWVKETTNVDFYPNAADLSKRYNFSVGGSGHGVWRVSKLPELDNLLWKFKTEGGAVHSIPAFANGKVFFLGSNGCQQTTCSSTLYSVDINTGQENWKFKSEGDFKDSSSPVIADSRVFFGTREGYLYSLDINTGQEMWKFKCEGVIESIPVVADGKVFFGSREGYFYALDINTGKEKWKFKIEERNDDWLYPHRVVVADGKVFLRSNLYLYSVDIKTRKEIWKFSVDERIFGGPVMADGKLLFGCEDGNLYAVDASTGKEIWHFDRDIGTYDPVTVGPVTADGKVFFVTHEGGLYSVDINTGQEIWKGKTEEENDVSSFADRFEVSHGYLFISSNRYLYSVDIDTGKVMWKFSFHGGISSSPVVAEGKVFFGRDDGYFYAVEKTLK